MNTNKRYLVLQAKRAFNGSRFPVLTGEIRILAWNPAGGPDSDPFNPRLAAQVRAGETIDWGGASVSPQDYSILWDQDGKLPQMYLRPEWWRNERDCMQAACRSTKACQYFPDCAAPMHSVLPIAVEELP